MDGGRLGSQRQSGMSSRVVEVVDITDGDNVTVAHRLEVDGVPKAQARARLGRHGFYNPKSKEMKAFKARVRTGFRDGPLFGPDEPIVVSVQFFMKRPLVWLTSRATRGRMGSRHGRRWHTPAGLINLVKFILDGLNKITWPDDAQVVKLVASKMYDNEGGCEGRTVVDINRFTS